MILVDTSVWIDHFRASDVQLTALLNQTQVLGHPYVIGEIALGSVKRRAQIVRDLGNLPAAMLAAPAEVLLFVERHKLANSGVGYVDAALLASAALSNAGLWTRDKNLRACAARCGVAPGVKLN